MVTEFSNLCVVADCVNDKVPTSDFCAGHQHQAAQTTITTITFDAPGQIEIRITPPGFEQRIVLEEVFNNLEADPSDLKEWERVFLSLARLCREKSAVAA